MINLREDVPLTGSPKALTDLLPKTVAVLQDHTHVLTVAFTLTAMVPKRAYVWIEPTVAIGKVTEWRGIRRVFDEQLTNVELFCNIHKEDKIGERFCKFFGFTLTDTVQEMLIYERAS